MMKIPGNNSNGTTDVGDISMSGAVAGGWGGGNMGRV